MPRAARNGWPRDARATDGMGLRCCRTRCLVGQDERRSDYDTMLEFIARRLPRCRDIAVTGFVDHGNAVLKISPMRVYRIPAVGRNGMTSARLRSCSLA
jgi:hypothetical protein